MSGGYQAGGPVSGAAGPPGLPWQPRPYVPTRGPLVLFELALRAIWSNRALTVPILLFAGVSSLSGLFSLMALIGLAAYLSATGVLRRLVDALLSPRPVEILALLASPEVLRPIVFSLAACLLASIIAGALASALSYSGLYEMARELLVKGRTGLATFLQGMTRNWRRVLPVALVLETVVEVPIWLFLIALFYEMALVLLQPAAATVTSLLRLLGLSLLLLIYILAIYILTFYVLVAAVLRPELGISGAFSASFGTLAKKPGETILLVIFEAALRAGLASLASFLTAVSVNLTSLVSLIIMLVFEPVFQVARVGIFIQAEGEVVGLEPAEWRVKEAISSSFREGLESLRSFLSDRGNLLLVLWAVLPMALGLLLGAAVGSMEDLRYAARALGLLRPGRLNELVRWPLGLTTSFYIAFYNWRIALSSATSGLLAGLPVLLFLFANGLVIGLVGALIGDVVLALSALLPHGVVEIPAFLIASACGLRMGLAFRAFGRGEIGLEEFVSIVRRCVYALVGLLPLFILAGLIEGLVTPLVMSASGWA